ncbi:MAG: helix-turn-helix domain-containing protein [Alphaproteobacteria bacterium]|nr:helix-turn-helix domain-containing protein [Alphaproteobacteria bacterium]MCB9984651.1 helix-turn-helix domain-containing protein [Micavibrio sp.]
MLLEHSTAQDQKRYLSEKQTADYIGLSVKTLQRMRVSGNGMPFIKAGARVLYDINDLNAYMSARKVQSTSAYGER